MQTQSTAEYPTEATIYEKQYGVRYYRDKELPPNTPSTDTRNHILYIVNPIDRRAVESAVRQAETAMKGCIDDYVVQHH